MPRARARSPITELLLVASVAALLAPRTVPAQQLSESFALWEPQTAVARVRSGDIVRLRMRDGRRAGGPLLRWNAYSATLGPYLGYAEADTVVALAAIDSLWIRTYRTRQDALTGAVVGGIFGLVVGSQAASLCPTQGGAKPCAQGAVTSAMGGALLGGLTGALLGSGTTRWRRLLPRGGSSTDHHSVWTATLVMPGDEIIPDARALALMRSTPGSLVKLSFGEHPDLAGYVARAGVHRASFNVVAGPRREDPIPLAQVEAIWERATAKRTGLAIGFVVGSAAAVFVATQSSACAPEGCGNAIVADGLLGGLIGGVIGRFTGARIPQWHRLY
jgi:hypothetical protein